MCRLLAILSLMLPFAAIAQAMPAPMVRKAVNPDVAREASHASGIVMPLWRAGDGHMLALVSMPATPVDGATTDAFSLRIVDASSLFSAGLAYDIAPRIHTHLMLSGRSWLGSMTSRANPCLPSQDLDCITGTLVSPLRMVHGELGATFRGQRYSVNLAMSKTQSASVALPRVVPNAGATFNDSTGFSAAGRLALNQRTGIDLGASIGLIRLLPGSAPGVDALAQKSLSLGMDHGPCSGRIVGRLLEPYNMPDDDDGWASIDLGITVRLPWRGELSFGARNLWSSHVVKRLPSTSQPDRSRIPYVQYHQDL